MKARYYELWAAAALAVFAIYIGGYLLIVRPAPLHLSAGLLPYGETLPLPPQFRFGEHAATRIIFSPIIRIDSAIRPARWTYTETNHPKPFCAYQIELEEGWRRAAAAVTNK
jgi:hypothetical protein